jgi:hypothetical protein
MRKSLPLIFFLFLFLPGGLIFAETLIVGGDMSYRFAVSSPDQEILDNFPEYRNNSNSQQVTSREPGRIEVETKALLSDFSSTIPFPVGDRYRGRRELEDYLEYATRQSGVRVTVRDGVRSQAPFEQINAIPANGVAALRRRAEMITAGSETQQEAVEKVVLSLREDVSYLLNASADPLRVLRDRRADCDGYSNAAALLLRTLGIPVKVVDSWIPPGHMWGYGPTGSGGFHAHIEVYYDDAGWVSSDVQATLHFVDPFHIVGYPRSNVRFEPLHVDDGRTILGLTPRPKGESHFFRRLLDGERTEPLFVGRLTDLNGELVKDSPRSGQWIYLRSENGSGTGLMVLPSGDFAVSAAILGESGKGTIFYPGGEGGYFEYQVDLSGAEKGTLMRRHFDMRRIETFSLQLPRGKTRFFRWHHTTGGSWNLETISTGREGLFTGSSNAERWIISLTNNAADPRYLLSPESGDGALSLSRLEIYLEPGKRYLFFPSLPSDSSLHLFDGRGRTYAGGTPSSSLPLIVPDDSFDRMLLHSASRLYFGSTGPERQDDGALRHDIALQDFDRAIEVQLPPGRRALLLLEKDGRQWKRLLRVARPESPYLLSFRSSEEHLLENLSVLLEGGGEPAPLLEAGRKIDLSP